MSATRDDMSSLTSVTSEAQGVLVSRPISPEHPSISSYIYPRLSLGVPVTGDVPSNWQT